MASNPFSVNVRYTTNAAILDLHGDINGQADQALDAAFAEAIAREQDQSVILNFSDVNYTNSTGC